MVCIATGYDATAENFAHLPAAGVACGYTTGGSLIAWTDAMWAARPGAVRICQDAGATDITADILDVESGAATIADGPVWATHAMASYDAVTRPGQRWPGIYCSKNNVTPVVDGLIHGGVTSGVNLWVADWDITDAEATAEVQATAGPFPIIGVQWTDSPEFYDIDVFDAAWLNEVSKHAPVPSTGPTVHRATGLESLATVCRNRNVPLQRALWLTADHMTSGFSLEQREYFNKGDMDDRMPLGMLYVLP